MTEPRFLTIREVLELHRQRIERHGGLAGVREMNLLESAVAAPQAGHTGGYFLTDLFQIAASYLFHIVKNHRFMDGNKRTGTADAIVFLRLNAIDLTANVDEFESLVQAVAAGKSTQDDVTDFLRRNA